MNKKMLPHLSRKGDPKIGQKGEFNPTAMYNYHNRQTADAVDNLRQLVERTYGDQAEQVKAQIRERYEQAIPDIDDSANLAEELRNLKAITSFYNQVADEIEEGVFETPRDEPTTIFEMAKQVIEEKFQWSSGETVTLWTGKVHKVYITEGGEDGGGLLYLGMGNKQVEVVVGHLNPAVGWQFTLTRQYYNAWVLKILRAYRMTTCSWRPDVVMDFGKGNMNQFREGRLSPEYRKRAQRARGVR